MVILVSVYIPKDMVFQNEEAFFSWIASTCFPFTEKVQRELRKTFILEAVERYLADFPADAGGTIHIRMMRLEIEARPRKS